MINLHVFLCKIEGCPTIPSFAMPGFEASRCAAHAEQGMVDVKSKRCEAAGCGVRPHFGPPGGRRKYCSVHAGPGDVNLSKIKPAPKAGKAK